MKNPYKCFNNFLFRTSFFSYDVLSSFVKNKDEHIFREMLQIATPDLSDDIFNEDKNQDKAMYSAYRYYQRACTRPTPFGLFAGCSVGTTGEQTQIQLSNANEYQRCTRLDMNYICALIQQTEKDKHVRKQLIYRPNTSIYPVGNHLRYVEYHYRKTRRIHQITQVDNSEYLQMILQMSENGMKFADLALSLVDDEIDMDEATEFIHELIDAQILVSELEPSVSNVAPLETLIFKLSKLQNIDNDFLALLQLIQKQLSKIDRQTIGSTNDIYPVIINNIEQTKIEAEIKYLFQADMFKPVQYATVSHNIIKDIQQALTFLNKITMSPQQTILSQFRENFVKRYDAREMPLLYVLDNELGIEYSGNPAGDISPLVDDLIIQPPYSTQNISMSPFQSLLLQKYQKALQRGEQKIELSDEDVKGVAAQWDDLPCTMSVMSQIVRDDEENRTIHIKSVSGSSAANLLGRFCHLEEQILQHALSITQKEAELNPDVIFAEIVHLPESRIGNILLRHVLRPYEISYIAQSGVPKEHEIRLSDLYLSVRNNRFVLRSKRLDKEIIPRMSTAHNYSGTNPMPIYHFLCDMQHQNGRVGLWFSWNEAANQFDYLPRVVYKNCILSQARWTVRQKEIEPFLKLKEEKELLNKIQEWLYDRNIPNKVLLADGDNELYVNMQHPLSVRSWLAVVKKRTSFYLEEMLFNPDTAVVKSQEGVYNNEFIFAFYRDKK